MRLWLLALFVVTTTLADDSLRSALQAIGQRQRELNDAQSRSRYPLRRYHYLNMPKQYAAGVGQPENIGYGFQKSDVGGRQMFYTPPQTPETMMAAESNIVDDPDGVLVDYVPDEERGRISNTPFREQEKKSVFREQQAIDGKSDIMKKLKQRAAESADEGEYLSYLQSLWRKYKQEYPAGDNNDDMSEEDLVRILNYLRKHNALRKDNMEEMIAKHFNEENRRAAMGSYIDGPRDVIVWDGRNHLNKRDDEMDGEGEAFHAWKYGTPTSDMEYAGVFGGEGDFAGQSPADVDNSGVNYKYEDRSREQWFPTVEEYGEKEVVYPQEDRPRKRTSSNIEQPYGFLQPVFSRKRFAITKRSPKQYASPPLLHHEKRTSNSKYGMQKKSDNFTTDPRVVNELNEIFSDDEVDPDYGRKYEEKHYGKILLEPKPKNNNQKDFTKMLLSKEMREKAKNGQKVETKGTKENGEAETVGVQQAGGPIEIKKKSVDWSDYFGIDRRSMKVHPEHGHHCLDSADRDFIAEKWLQRNNEELSAKLTPEERENSRMFKVYGAALKRSQLFSQPFDTRNFETGATPRILQKTAASKKNDKNQEDNNTEPLKIDSMDKKLQRVEDLILNQAVKYTGAHEDTTDTRELQNVKNNVISQLAAAYSLEKIRKSLGEFKSLLAEQKNSNLYSEADVGMDLEEKMNKRRVVKKSMAITKGSANAGKINPDDDESNFENSVIQILEDPLALAELSEGYMGGELADENGECTSVNKLLTNCQMPEENSDILRQMYAPLCCLRQLCYACSPLLGKAPVNCEALMMDVCGGHPACLDAAQHCDPSSPNCSCVVHLVTE